MSKELSQVKAIFWDNDGVLVDTERLYFQANAEVLCDEGVELSREIFREHWLKNSHGLNFIAESLGWSDEKLARLRVERNDRYAELLSRGDVVFPGVRETLAAIPRGILQAIVTSSRRDHFELIHAKSEILPFMSFVIGEGDYKRSKPSPDPYHTAIKRSQCRPEECLVIEDSERGLVAAKRAGIRCLVLENPLSKGAQLEWADGYICDISEVLSFLDSA